ncbi:MAG: 3-phosphoshikimate 1-carboxyvinyltransferase [Alicyclobacillaceae bacterium]|nr:3-phosphoshikimate 1-carboxyvinyltransferase [Alicyclobacillaceae bacterium]
MEPFEPDLQARSPWATLGGVAEVAVSPVAKPVDATLVVPGSKSFTNRALIIAAVAEGVSNITGLLRSDDSYWCIDALRRLGVRIDVQGDTATVHGCGGRWPVTEAELYFGAAGTIARILPGTLAAARGGPWLLRGSQRLSERPLRPLMDALRDLGADIRYLAAEGRLPLELRGFGLRGGRVRISGRTSSQFISGLLIASPLASSEVVVEVEDHIVQHSYVHISIDLMRRFGAVVGHDEQLREIRVQPGGYRAQTLPLEADASTSCYFLALAAITGGRVRVSNLSYQTRQPDVHFVDLLERMGCTVVRGDGYVEVIGPHRRLRGGFTVSMREMSDQALTVAAIAPFADAPVRIAEVAHIRGHESDRIRAMCECLRRLGVQAEEHQDGVTVHPGEPQPALLPSFDDHRVAMSFALVGAAASGVRIADPGCVSKTCPTYFEILQTLGVPLQFHQNHTDPIG